jgi:hypothetical protein
MKPDWDKLSDEFADSASTVIADVDCTVDSNKALCGKYGVRGYPTIKYFTDSTDPMGDKYEGKRDFASLKKFATESLGPTCGHGENLELCSDEDKAFLEEWAAKGADAIAAEVATHDDAITASKDNMEELMKSLQTQFEAAKKADEELGAEHSKPLSLLRTIKVGGNDEL